MGESLRVIGISMHDLKLFKSSVVAYARTKINSFPFNSVYLYSARMERKIVAVSLHDSVDCVRKVRYLLD